MPQLTANGQLFELSELAAQQSVTLVNIMNDSTGNAPINDYDLGSDDLAKVTALLERTAKLNFGSDARRDELFEHGLPRGAALDDELRAATGAALDDLGAADRSARYCQPVKTTV